MHRKTAIDLEIERRIADRDRLLLRAQRSRGVTATATEVVPSAELMILVQRAAHLELALSRYLDEQWIRGATPEELMLNARDALEMNDDDVLRLEA
ncbi:MAG: hypothetical protein M3081_01870 [Gemmatimonadota bacterium]|nr:hypothetical protein [Gemmatimonadota bacterium]